jgi:hypothetical protein
MDPTSPIAVGTPVEVSTRAEDRPVWPDDPSHPPACRRQRRLALPAGVVLALCVFLPALRVCGSPTYPVEIPPAWPPYLLGAIVAAMALSRRLETLRGWTTVALLIGAGTGGAFGLIAAWGGRGEGLAWGLGLWLVGGLFVWLIVRGRGIEERAARTVIGVGALCTPWFALLAFDPDGMIGARVSLAASVALIIAGVEWRRELARARDWPVPPARARPG